MTTSTAKAPTQHKDYDPLLTVEEAANYLAVHAETIRRMIRSRQISCVRASATKGSNAKIRLSVLNAWVRTHEIKAVRDH